MPSALGGPVRLVAADRLANSALRYNQFRTSFSRTMKRIVRYARPTAGLSAVDETIIGLALGG